MDMTGEYLIPAPRQRVWEALNDADVLKECIPGCQSIEKLSATEFTAKVVAKVGPVKATFGGKVSLSDLDPPKGYNISGEGTGGVAGFAKGGAHVELVEEDGGTLLKYTAQAHVGGKLAQIGSRLVGATAKKMADDFFGHFAGRLTGAPAEGGSEPSGGTAANGGAGAAGGANLSQAPGGEPQAQARAGGGIAELRLPPAVWVGGVTAIIAVMLYFFAVRGAIR